MGTIAKEMEEFLKNMDLDSITTDAIDISDNSATIYGVAQINKKASKSCVAVLQCDAKPIAEEPPKLGISRTSATRSRTNSPVHPGQCFIFNHVEFNNNYMSTREGSDVDAVRLRETFEVHLKLEVSEHTNPPLAEITQEIEKIRKADYSAYACVVIVILSHGDRYGKICAYDGEFSLDDDIVFPILENPTLKEKPKLFFIQACKGNMTITKQIDSKPIKKIIGSCDNILICYSTFEGYVSYRDPATGTFFIKALCENLNKSEKTESVQAIMKKVMKEVQEEAKGKQVPSCYTTMYKDFIFGGAL